MATIRDVAKLAGVSVATVSRVLNQNGYVNKETEKTVMQSMKELSFEPSQVARRLAGKTMKTISLILPDISNPFFPELARGVEDIAQQHQFNVFLGNSDNLEKKEKSYIDVMQKKSIDGLIIVSNTVEEETIRKLQNAKIPVVLLDRPLTGNNCSIVRARNSEGAQLAVKHLFEVGCKKIAHISGPDNINPAYERLIAYTDMVSDYDWFSESLIEEGGFDIKGGREAMKRLLQSNADIDGVFAGNDLMALGALKELLQMGIKVPEQIAICGFDGIQLTEYTEPGITTIAQPIYEMGALATEVLIKKIQGEEHENKIFELPVKLIQRNSTNKNHVQMGGLAWRKK
ncbi:LacI family DNA-binding transcriptional regulator [Bacillus sp. JJ1122]|uniref:LacI family DNA-binding transcriptional regulator n=1 Tax=Bacillus sp. JJ1122 TaxID=3122951 RepID=UPI002FFE9786